MNAMLMRRSALAVFASLLFLLVGLVASAQPAAAHDALVETNPADGEIVATAPSELQLSFSGEIMDLAGANLVVVSDASGAEVAAGELKISGTDVQLPLNDPLAAGAYKVVWRVVSSDGHPIEGSYVFGVGDATQSDLDQLAAAPSAGDPQAAPNSAGTDTTNAPPGTGAVIAASIAVLIGSGIVVGVIVWYTRQNKKSAQ